MRRVLVWLGAGFAACIVVALFLYAFYSLPRELVGRGSGSSALSQADLLEARSDVRTTAIQALAGLAVIVGTVLTARAALATIRQTREGQFTDRFTAAIDHLAEVDEVKKLGGIHELARVARQSDLDHWPAMEVLSAYLRANHPAVNRAEPMEGDAPAEVRAISAVLRERDSSGEQRKLGQRLDLFEVDLRKAQLAGADLTEANLAECDLRGAFLAEAKLARATLDGADLRGADIRGADLGGASLLGADARGVSFEEVDLRKAKLAELDLRQGADLRKARHDAEISSARRDETTQPPP